MRRSVRNSDDQENTLNKKDRITADAEDACRCKAVSGKSLTELLKLMIKDLAFWKRTGRK